MDEFRNLVELYPTSEYASLAGEEIKGIRQNLAAHEMLVGFVGAAMAGFLLTAVPSFTGRDAVRGLPLAWLAAAWLGGSYAFLAVAAAGALWR